MIAEPVSFKTPAIQRALGLLAMIFTGISLLRDRRTVGVAGESKNRYHPLSEWPGLGRAEGEQERLERFRNIFYSSDDACAYVTCNGCVREANEAFVRLTGRSRKEWLQPEVFSGTFWSPLRLSYETFRRVGETGRSLVFDTHVQPHTRKGNACPVNVHVFPVLGSNGRKAGLAVVIRQITDLNGVEAEFRRASEELLAKNEALVRSNELLSAAQRIAARAQRLSAVGQFAATIAHGIGTPLTALSGHVQLLMEDHTLAPQVRERLQKIEGQIERTSHVIQDLLLYTRRAAPVRQLVSINECVQHCLPFFRIECDRQHVACLVDLKADLPAVEADRQHLQEAVTHLIENALQAMPQGGSLSVRTFVPPPTSTGFFDCKGCVAIEVTDTGCGINPEYLAQIFQPFFTTKQAGGGTGLGLAIVQETVRTHGGKVSVESEPGRTRFTITLPVFEQQPHLSDRII